MIAYVDCTHGVSGMSLLAGLVDAGADVDELAASLRFLAPDALKLRADETLVEGIRSTRIHVEDGEARIADAPGDLLAAIHGGGLAPSVLERTSRIYRRLIAAEAHVHGVEEDAVRFRELGRLRSLIGVVGTAHALEQLRIDFVRSSPIPFGGGIAVTHHGPVSLPAPATLELLRGVPVEGQEPPGELVTPTGVAILTTLASGFGVIPAMTVDRIGIGSARTDSATIMTRVVSGLPTS